jgi:hypothetical protein
MVPESERWLHAKDKGATSHWATRDLLGVVVGAIGPLSMIYLWATPQSWALRIVGSIVALAIAVGGYLFPVVRYLQRGQRAVADGSPSCAATVGRMLLAACLSGVALIGTWASLQNAPSWADKLVEDSMKGQSPEMIAAARSEARSYTQIFSAIGAIIGTIVGALIGNAIGRRLTYTLMCLGSLLTALAFFQLNTSYGVVFLAMVLLAGGMTASFYGWFPLYLPELFRTTVRATGQGFGYNFGRILAAVAALQTGFLLKEVFNDNFPMACSVMSLVYLIGLAIIWLAPETRGKPLPE